MIKISALKDEDIGRGVIYIDHIRRDAGVITSWNNRFIFVRYGSLKHSQATQPADLEWEFADGSNSNRPKGVGTDK